MGETDRRLMNMARRQHGLLTRVQGRRAGLSDSAWGRRIADATFIRAHPGVVRLASAPQTDPQRILAAVLAVGEGAVGSHISAARMWGCEVDDWPVDLTITDAARSARLHGVRVHRTTVLTDLRAVRRRGVPITSPLRTMADVGAVLSEQQVEEVLQHFLNTGLLTASAVRAIPERHGGRGRPGIGVLRAVLRRWEIGGAISDSTFEVLVAAHLAENRLPAPHFHHRIGRYEVDFAFPDVLVAVEVDGWSHHGHRVAFESDRARDLELAARGWLVVRLTWWAVTNRPTTTFEQLRQVVEQRSAA